MIKALYVPDYKEHKYGSSFLRLAKYADAANFGGEKVELLSFDYDPEEPTKSIRELRLYYYAHDIDLLIGSSLGGFLAACCPRTCGRVNTISKGLKEPCLTNIYGDCYRDFSFFIYFWV